jgi:hypothetical protein
METTSGSKKFMAGVPGAANGTASARASNSSLTRARNSSFQDVDAWLYSTPSLLGAMTADGDGKVSGAFNLPSGLDVGDHRLVLSGENPDGAAVLVGIGLSYGTVQSGSTVTRVLIAIPIALAVLFGLFLPAVTRRRKKNAFA